MERPSQAKKGGYLGTGMTIELAREKAKDIVSYDESRANRRASTSEVPFSRGAKRVFEAALAASQSAGMNYIAPEHVAVAAATLDDDALVAFFAAMNADRAAVNAEAERRLKGEREREGNNRSSGPSSPAARGAGSTPGAGSGGKESSEKSPLADFCFDLTARAR